MSHDPDQRIRQVNVETVQGKQTRRGLRPDDPKQVCARDDLKIAPLRLGRPNLNLGGTDKGNGFV